MKTATMDMLCCPACQSPLTMHGEQAGEQVDSGELYCTACAHHYPIQDGIPRFLDPDHLEGSNRRMVRFYDRLAPFYSLAIKATFLAFGGDRAARQEILGHLESRGGRTLEVSIGEGANLPYLYEAQPESEVYGVDISSGQLNHCRKRTRRRGWPVDLFLANAEKLPFKTASFDTVFHIGGINFFSDPQGAIVEMIRVARPGSRIVIADEAERLAKRAAPKPALPASQVPGDGETSLTRYVPTAMEELRVDGIWKMHGRHHGYCLTFRKPVEA